MTVKGNVREGALNKSMSDVDPSCKIMTRSNMRTLTILRRPVYIHKTKANGIAGYYFQLNDNGSVSVYNPEGFVKSHNGVTEFTPETLWNQFYDISMDQVVIPDVSGVTDDESDNDEEVTQAPVQVYQAPVQVYQAPVQVYQAPVQVAQAPVQVAQAPVQVAQAPVQVAQAPVQVAQAPVQVAAAAPVQAVPPLQAGDAANIAHLTAQLQAVNVNGPAMNSTAMNNAAKDAVSENLTTTQFLTSVLFWMLNVDSPADRSYVVNLSSARDARGVIVNDTLVHPGSGHKIHKKNTNNSLFMRFAVAHLTIMSNMMLIDSDIINYLAKFIYNELFLRVANSPNVKAEARQTYANFRTWNNIANTEVFRTWHRLEIEGRNSNNDIRQATSSAAPSRSFGGAPSYVNRGQQPTASTGSVHG